MTEQEKLNTAWHVLIQWLSSRDELEEWMDDVNAAVDNGWHSAFDPLSGLALNNYNFFGWVPTCGRKYNKWDSAWRIVTARLKEEFDRQEISVEE